MTLVVSIGIITTTTPLVEIMIVHARKISLVHIVTCTKVNDTQTETSVQDLRNTIAFYVSQTVILCTTQITLQQRVSVCQTLYVTVMGIEWLTQIFVPHYVIQTLMYHVPTFRPVIVSSAHQTPLEILWDIVSAPWGTLLPTSTWRTTNGAAFLLQGATTTFIVRNVQVMAYVAAEYPIHRVWTPIELVYKIILVITVNIISVHVIRDARSVRETLRSTV